MRLTIKDLKIYRLKKKNYNIKLQHYIVRCIQRVANPSPYSLFYLFLYRSLSCLSPELFNTDSSGSPNNQDAPKAPVNKNL